MEEAEIWRPYFDGGATQSHAQPSRTRAIALQISLLCEISGDLLLYFYHPNNIGKPQGKQAELKKLSELHTRLEAWKKNLPKELEPREGQLPSVLVMQYVIFENGGCALTDLQSACSFSCSSSIYFAHS